MLIGPISKWFCRLVEGQFWRTPKLKATIKSFMVERFPDFKMDIEFASQVSTVFKKKSNGKFMYVQFQRNKYGYGMFLRLFVTGSDNTTESICIIDAKHIKSHFDNQKVNQYYAYYSQKQLDQLLSKVENEISGCANIFKSQSNRIVSDEAGSKTILR